MKCILSWSKYVEHLATRQAELAGSEEEPAVGPTEETCGKLSAAIDAIVNPPEVPAEPEAEPEA